MSTPKAGHAWTAFIRRGKRIDLIANDAGAWVPSSDAKGWRKCVRCRRPYENGPFGTSLCVMCFFYHSGIDIDEFWRLHNEAYWLAPYVIGRRIVENMAWDRRPLSDPRIDWQSYLRTQPAWERV